MKVLILNGPNLNLLGEREVGVYGTVTLDAIEEELREHVKGSDVELEFFQSNHEGALIDTIQEARHTFSGIVYNPGAHTHYSYALRDAIASIPIPVVEVHLSDISSREEFRRTSVIEPVCIGQVSGLGSRSYVAGLDMLIERQTQTQIEAQTQKREDS